MSGRYTACGIAGEAESPQPPTQIVIAGNMIGAVEALLYTHKAGLGLDAMIDIVGKGAASSWSKDMGIALQEARRMNMALPGLALVNQFYVSAQALGLENLGTQGLYKVLAAMNAIQT